MKDRTPPHSESDLLKRSQVRVYVDGYGTNAPTGWFDLLSVYMGPDLDEDTPTKMGLWAVIQHNEKGVAAETYIAPFSDIEQIVDPSDSHVGFIWRRTSYDRS